MARITQVRDGKIQQLRLIRLVRLMAARAHAAHDRGMHIRLRVILRLVMTVEADILRKKQLLGTTHMRVVAPGTHASLNRHVHGISPGKFALVVTREA